jgi:hypothetical protein
MRSAAATGVAAHSSAASTSHSGSDRRLTS